MTKEVKKAFWQNLIINLGIIAGCIIPLLLLKGELIINWFFISLIILAFSFIVQIIQALIYVSDPDGKEKGQGMLISIGLILLMGGLVCSSTLFF